MQSKININRVKCTIHAVHEVLVLVIVVWWEIRHLATALLGW
jgi:hypothetical protein